MAIDESLLKKFDKPIAKKFGTLTLVYDHRARMLTDKVTELQHRRHTSILPQCMYVWITITACK